MRNQFNIPRPGFLKDDHGNVLYFDVDGQLHRDDGPAIEQKDGSKAWFRHGVKHRDDGPAVELPTVGHREWWINGTQISHDEFQARHVGLAQHPPRDRAPPSI